MRIDPTPEYVPVIVGRGDNLENNLLTRVVGKSDGLGLGPRITENPSILDAIVLPTTDNNCVPCHDCLHCFLDCLPGFCLHSGIGVAAGCSYVVGVTSHR